jgi:hypothetical protein
MSYSETSKLTMSRALTVLPPKGASLSVVEILVDRFDVVLTPNGSEISASIKDGIRTFFDSTA